MLLIGEQDVVQTPLICTAELQCLRMIDKEIENIFCYYLLPSVSHYGQCCVNIDSFVANACKNECNPTQPFLSLLSLQHPVNNSATATNSEDSKKFAT